MTDIEAAVDAYVEPATPDLAEVQQRPDPDALLVLPARLVEPAAVQVLPARAGAAFVQPLNTQFAHVLGQDPKRRRVVLLGSADWEYSRTGNSGSGVPWPTDVPLVLEHCDAIYARVPTSTGQLSVIAESWAE